MSQVYTKALDALKSAFADGKKYLLIRHGWSTSLRGATTARSQVRALMRSSDATPYIVRSECIQHEAVFVAAATRTLSRKERKNLLNRRDFPLLGQFLDTYQIAGWDLTAVTAKSAPPPRVRDPHGKTRAPRT